MNTLSQSLDSSGPTVEEAIVAGLEQMNLSRDDVDVEILDEGSKGLFGLGSREALVRLTPLGAPSTPATLIPQKPADPSIELPEVPTEADQESVSVGETSVDALNMEEDEILTVARETVEDLLQRMHVDAEVTATFQEQEEERRHRPNILVEINGDDLSILIGRQAETLNALQYLTRLIVGKELNRGVDLEVDVQGYRARRNEQLRRLARQMADQAIRTGKRQYLEPMASDDRRIIHIELRQHPQVTTESMGEGDRRKVTIFLR